jgi:DNA-binding NarL/FixJ family response regulator
MKTPSVPDCQVKVFVLSDVLLYREGLSRQLEKDRRVELTGAGPPTPELVSTLEFTHPDVIVMDLSMHDSLGIVRRIRELRPEVRVVAFAVSDLSEEIVACAKAGICGYIPKEGTIEDIVMTALHAARGELYCSPKFAAFLLEQVARAGPTPSPPPLAARLTARECEIVSLMQRGLSNKEIGQHTGKACRAPSFAGTCSTELPAPNKGWGPRNGLGQPDPLLKSLPRAPRSLAGRLRCRLPTASLLFA